MKRDILKGFIDVHVHAGPSVAAREADAGEVLKEAQAAGYAGFLVKDHYFPTMAGARMVERHLGDGTCRVYGAVVLNNSVGLFNLKAVEAARRMDAKLVYFPTVSAKNHIDRHRGAQFAGSGAGMLPEVPVVYVDQTGRMLPEAAEVLRYMGRYGMALGTGHGSLREVDHLVKEALKLGVGRILVNHPHFNMDASLEDMARWAGMGAYIELNACVFKGGSLLGSIEDELAAQIIRACGPERIVLDSDLGQKGNGSPVEGMYRFICMLMGLGVSEEEINIMGKRNPALLLGL